MHRVVYGKSQGHRQFCWCWLPELGDSTQINVNKDKIGNKSEWKYIEQINKIKNKTNKWKLESINN